MQKLLNVAIVWACGGMGVWEEKELRMSNNECRMEKELTAPSIFDIRHSILSHTPNLPHPFLNNNYAVGLGIRRVHLIDCSPHRTPGGVPSSPALSNGTHNR